ncbi:MAG: HyaD/HybD family hydrogenase maturation endopeptidase [Thermodesulfobacteriota bacterium]
MAEREKTMALVLGVGNILMGDEGVGVRAVELFRKTYSLPEDCACIDGGTAGVSLLDYMKEFAHVVIIDAISSGGPPAAIRRFKGDEIDCAPPSRTTAHQIGVKELIVLARFEGASPDVRLIGVVPGRIGPGLRLSAPVEGALPEVARMIARELSALGFNVRKKEDARDGDNEKHA